MARCPTWHEVGDTNWQNLEGKTMGIVVTVFMLLGLLAACPYPLRVLSFFQGKPQLKQAIGIGLMLTGLWNSLWFGLRHWSEFWGLAALGSGLCMIVVACVLLWPVPSALGSQGSAAEQVGRTAKRLAPVALAGLLAAFLLYSISLIRLNLGLPIPG
jgi:hypothetical protein